MHDLTARELQVLALIALGLTDKEIAVDLGIGRPTASNHVGRILLKLGVRNRSAAAVWAVSIGLVPDAHQLAFHGE